MVTGVVVDSALQMLSSFRAYIPWNQSTEWWIIGVVLATTASFVSNLGFNLQKLAHMRVKVTETYYMSGIWITGLVLVVLASILDFIALGFATQTVIAPLGSLTLVANMLFAPIIVGEVVQSSDILSTISIIFGTALSVGFASHQDPERLLPELFALFVTWRFLGYAIVIIITIIGMWGTITIIEKNHTNNSEPLRRFLYASLAGTIGAQNVLFAKCLAELMINWVSNSESLDSKSIFLYYQTYFMVFCLAASIFWQVKWLNDGLRQFDALYIVPVFQSFWVLVSVLSGLVFFEEYKTMSYTQLTGFPIAVLITITGVYFLSQRTVVSSPGGLHNHAFINHDDDDDNNVIIDAAREPLLGI